MLDTELRATWSAMNDEGRHDENLRMLGRLLTAAPRDPDLHLLLASTLYATDRVAESLEATRRAIDLGGEDPAVLVQAASQAFYAGGLTTARAALDSAKKIAPRGFALRKELQDLDRNVDRRMRGLEEEKRLAEAFDLDPGRPGAAAELAQHFARNGQSFAAYHAVMRGLRYWPNDRALRRLERGLGPTIPPETRQSAEAWAASEKPFRIQDAGP
jgi:thioredoxin-like negative regulator of GroEL